MKKLTQLPQISQIEIYDVTEVKHAYIVEYMDVDGEDITKPILKAELIAFINETDMNANYLTGERVCAKTMLAEDYYAIVKRYLELN